jgi:hypothetical protein
LELYLADLELEVGSNASSREDLMVEIRVAADEAPAPVIARRSPSTTIRAEIRVRSEGESRPVVAVIDDGRPEACTSGRATGGLCGTRG